MDSSSVTVTLLHAIKDVDTDMSTTVRFIFFSVVTEVAKDTEAKITTSTEFRHQEEDEPQ